MSCCCGLFPNRGRRKTEQQFPRATKLPSVRRLLIKRNWERPDKRTHEMEIIKKKASNNTWLTMSIFVQQPWRGSACPFIIYLSPFSQPPPKILCSFVATARVQSCLKLRNYYLFICLGQTRMYYSYEAEVRAHTHCGTYRFQCHHARYRTRRRTCSPH